MGGVNCHWLYPEIQSRQILPRYRRLLLLVGLCLVAFRKANLSGVPEHRPGSDIYLADVADVSRCAREFTGSSFDVYGVGHNSKQGLSLRDRNGCRNGWIEQDGISCFGNPVVLNMKHDGISRTWLRGAQNRSADRSLQVSRGNPHGGSGINRPEVRHYHTSHYLAGRVLRIECAFCGGLCRVAPTFRAARYEQKWHR